MLFMLYHVLFCFVEWIYKNGLFEHSHTETERERVPNENYVFARPTIKFNQSIKMCEIISMDENKRKRQENEWKFIQMVWMARLDSLLAPSFYTQWTPRKSNFVIHLNYTPFHAFSCYLYLILPVYLICLLQHRSVFVLLVRKRFD